MTWYQKVLLGLAVLALLVLVVFLPVFPVHAQVPSITLDWTSTGDDGNVGTATAYELRWRSVQPDTTSQATILVWWNLATPVTGLPIPLISGTSQSMVVSGPFTTGQTYYFILRAGDEVPNWSVYSNVAIKFIPDTIPPSRIIDLRPR